MKDFTQYETDDKTKAKTWIPATGQMFMDMEKYPPALFVKSSFKHNGKIWNSGWYMRELLIKEKIMVDYYTDRAGNSNGKQVPTEKKLDNMSNVVPRKKDEQDLTYAIVDSNDEIVASGYFSYNVLSTLFSNDTECRFFVKYGDDDYVEGSVDESSIDSTDEKKRNKEYSTVAEKLPTDSNGYSISYFPPILLKSKENVVARLEKAITAIDQSLKDAPEFYLKNDGTFELRKVRVGEATLSFCQEERWLGDKNQKVWEFFGSGMMLYCKNKGTDVLLAVGTNTVDGELTKFSGTLVPTMLATATAAKAVGVDNTGVNIVSATLAPSSSIVKKYRENPTTVSRQNLEKQITKINKTFTSCGRTIAKDYTNNVLPAIIKLSNSAYNTFSQGTGKLINKENMKKAKDGVGKGLGFIDKIVDSAKDGYKKIRVLPIMSRAQWVKNLVPHAVSTVSKGVHNAVGKVVSKGALKATGKVLDTVVEKALGGVSGVLLLKDVSMRAYSELPYVYQMVHKIEEFRTNYPSEGLEITQTKFAIFALIVEDMVNKKILAWEIEDPKNGIVKGVKRFDEGFIEYFKGLNITIEEICEAIEILDDTDIVNEWKVSVDDHYGQRNNVNIVRNKYGALRVKTDKEGKKGVMKNFRPEEKKMNNDRPWVAFATKGLIIGKDVTHIGEYAFNGCADLPNVTIQDGVGTIGKYAFSGCTKLESITIPKSVTSIGEMAFGHCVNLATIVCLNPEPKPVFSEINGHPDELVKGCVKNTLSISPSTVLYVPKGSDQKYKNTRGWKEFGKNIYSLKG